MDVVGIGGQVGSARRRGEMLDQRGLQLEGLADRGEVLVVSTIEVDPGQLAVTEIADETLAEFDLAIVPVGVVQPDLRSASLPPRGVQRIAARRTATTMARAAVPYCRTSIAWSDRRVAGPATRAVRPRKMGW